MSDRPLIDYSPVKLTTRRARFVWTRRRIVLTIMGLVVGGGVFYHFVRIFVIYDHYLACRVNLRAMGAHLREYCSANGGQYPPELGTLVATTGTWGVGAGWQKDVSDFVYVGAGLTDSAPPDTIVAYCGNRIGDTWPSFLFADGRVESLEYEKLQKYLADSAAGVAKGAAASRPVQTLRGAGTRVGP